MMDQHIPWGRPTVDWIPLPPFGLGQRVVFVNALAQYVQMLDSGPDITTRALIDTLLSQTGAGEQLSRLEFDIAVSTFFPAPWTPEAFAEQLNLHRPQQFNPWATGNAPWSWLFDPGFEARRLPGGGWNITRNERGKLSQYVLEHDGDLVLEWMDVFTRRTYSIETGDRETFVMQSLAPAVTATRKADAAEQAYPVHEYWRAKLQDTLGDG